jgi:hypothetical protein
MAAHDITAAQAIDRHVAMSPCRNARTPSCTNSPATLLATVGAGTEPPDTTSNQHHR